MPGASLSTPENSSGTTRSPDDRPLPVVFGFSHTELYPSERRFFADVNPFGFVLFKRNCGDPDQVRRLVEDLRHTVGRPDVPVFIDQEGGRVSRLAAPRWAQYPAARLFGQIYENDAELGAEAIQLYARIVANELAKLGVTVNCAPVVDLFMEGASPALGDRAYSRKPMIVAALARIFIETSLENGVLPVIKHFPGLGRIRVDPHDVLPTITASLAELESEDFVPFEFLKDAPLGMNSHAVYKALDDKLPASLSPTIHQDIIRGRMSFDGLLFSDDIAMKALQGLPADLAQKALAAGADVVLHCNGIYDEMMPIARVLKPINPESWARWEYAKSMVKPPNPAYNPAEDNGRLDILLGALAFEVKSAG